MIKNCIKTVKYLLNLILHHCFLIFYILVMVYFMHPGRFATHYEYIKPDHMYHSFLEKAIENISRPNQSECDYQNIIRENQFMYLKKYQLTIHDSHSIRLGGEYYPDVCRPLYSVAIVVVYRQREQQLNAFLIYMHNFLRKQLIHYRILLVEQYDQKPFNRGKLFNIGLIYAKRLGFPCTILHDVDLFPMSLGNLYACTSEPRHMCSSLDKFRFNLPYNGLFGGVVAIETDTFIKINGFSNMFQGWGGEDDDLFGRLAEKDIEICRFAPAYSRYTMMKHPEEKRNENRVAYLQNGSARYHTDGINSLQYEEKDYRLHNLFTHILVNT